MKIFKAIKNFFRSKYYVLYELITLKLMLRVNKMVRKLILSRGKDPDYVAPPPTAPTLDQETIKKRIERAHKFVGSSSMSNDYFVRDPSKHPILLNRRAYEDKLANLNLQENDVLQVAASVAIENTSSIQEALDLLVKMSDDVSDNKE